MNTKYKLIVVDTQNPTYSKITAEVAQRLALSFGYTSNWGILVPIVTNQVLVFNPNNKQISMLVCNARSNAVEIYTVEGLLEALKNPALATKTIDAGNGLHDASIFEDSITFRSKTSKIVGVVTVPKTFIRKVMGQADSENQSLLEVYFRYNGVGRIVQVTKMDDKYIQGFEVEKGGNLVIRSFKKYSKDQVEGFVDLISFRKS